MAAATMAHLYLEASRPGSERLASCSSGISTPTGQHDSALKTEYRELVHGDARRSRTPPARQHHRLDGYGVCRYEMWEVFDKTGDWGRLLAMFASTAEGAAK
jgi:hypothetical protein